MGSQKIEKTLKKLKKWIESPHKTLPDVELQERLSANKGFLTCKEQHPWPASHTSHSASLHAADIAPEEIEMALDEGEEGQEDGDESAVVLTPASPFPTATATATTSSSPSARAIVDMVYHVCYEPSYGVPSIYFQAHFQGAHACFSHTFHRERESVCVCVCVSVCE